MPSPWLQAAYESGEGLAEAEEWVEAASLLPPRPSSDPCPCVSDYEGMEDGVSEGLLGRNERAHRRLTWKERLARNECSKKSSSPWRIHLHGIPDGIIDCFVKSEGCQAVA